jgi:hypothetical protein
MIMITWRLAGSDSGTSRPRRLRRSYEKIWRPESYLEEKALRTKLLGGKWPRTKPLGGKRLRRDVLVRERAEDKGTLRSVVPAGGGC